MMPHMLGLAHTSPSTWKTPHTSILFHFPQGKSWLFPLSLAITSNEMVHILALSGCPLLSTKLPTGKNSPLLTEAMTKNHRALSTLAMCYTAEPQDPYFPCLSLLTMPFLLFSNFPGKLSPQSLKGFLLFPLSRISASQAIHKADSLMSKASEFPIKLLPDYYPKPFLLYIL